MVVGPVLDSLQAKIAHSKPNAIVREDLGVGVDISYALHVHHNLQVSARFVREVRKCRRRIAICVCECIATARSLITTQGLASVVVVLFEFAGDKGLCTEHCLIRTIKQLVDI